MKAPYRQSPQQLRLRQHAAQMRAVPTSSERLLWNRLSGRQLGVQFRRQVPWGSFILDFLAPAAALVVEVDGGSHRSRAAADARRDRKLQSAGLRVLRIPAELVLSDVESAVELVRAALKGSALR